MLLSRHRLIQRKRRIEEVTLKKISSVQTRQCISFSFAWAFFEVRVSALCSARGDERASTILGFFCNSAAWLILPLPICTSWSPSLPYKQNLSFCVLLFTTLSLSLSLSLSLPHLFLQVVHVAISLCIFSLTINSSSLFQVITCPCLKSWSKQLPASPFRKRTLSRSWWRPWQASQQWPQTWSPTSGRLENIWR